MTTIEEYVRLPYHFQLVPDEDEEGRRGWVVAEEAEREGVSLNQFVMAVLAGAVGWQGPRPARV